MNKVDEKRRHDRYEFQKTVRVYPVLPSQSGNIYEVQKESFEARTSDLSEGGLGLETRKPLDPHFLLKMNFEVENSQAVEVYGKVIWSTPNRCGVRFMYADSSLRRSIRSIPQKKILRSN